MNSTSVRRVFGMAIADLVPEQRCVEHVDLLLGPFERFGKLGQHCLPVKRRCLSAESCRFLLQLTGALQQTRSAELLLGSLACSTFVPSGSSALRSRHASIQANFLCC